DRSHRDFLMNLNLSAASVKEAMKRMWQAEKPLPALPVEAISKLAREKYTTAEWNRKFFHL
ncbi:MAG TPA: hypothetical protein VGY98_02425, partial [Verrucomicrobiae bacterium]|nr:hypothetical protein [Verrucomicrobiae bacterium]